MSGALLVPQRMLLTPIYLAAKLITVAVDAYKSVIDCAVKYWALLMCITIVCCMKGTIPSAA